MSRNDSRLTSSFTVALAAAVVVLSPLSVWASGTGPVYSFDFTDSYYRANGVEPTKLVNRVNGHDGISVTDTSSQSSRRDVRVLLTVPTYDHSGNLYFFHPLSRIHVTGRSRWTRSWMCRGTPAASPPPPPMRNLQQFDCLKNTGNYCN